MTMSVAESLAAKSDAERDELLSQYDLDSLQYDPDFWLRPEQLDALHAPQWLIMLLAGRGAGKELSYTTPVPSPSGWTTMGALQPGDLVFDEAGRLTRVLAVYDSIPKRAYRMKFSDGTEIDAGGEHQWVTWTHRDRKALNRNEVVSDFPEDWPTWTRDYFIDQWGTEREIDPPIGPKVRLSEEIAETLTHGKRGDLSHCIPVCGPLDLPDADLPLDPWLLGYWLGNGTARDTSLSTGSKEGDFDVEHVAGCIAAAGFNYSRRDLPERGYSTIRLRGSLGIFRGMGLLNNKHIPQCYLRASIEQRTSLLRGLMDSDGYADPKKCAVEFCSMDLGLAQGVLELARSLGEKAVLGEGRAMLDGQDYGTKYRVIWRPHINPFALPRKAEIVQRSMDGDRKQALRSRHRMITSMDEIDPIPMRCITVDSPNSMYLVSEAMIPTHNTRTLAEWVRDRAKIPNTRIALVARTVSDVRDTMVTGESGILAVTPPSEAPEYVPSARTLRWPNGSTALTFSAETSAQLRGPQFNFSACDELSSWRSDPDSSGLNAWDNLKIATRLGRNPQIMVATTPKRVKVIREIVTMAKEDPDRVHLFRSTTADNATNLSAAYLETIYGMYEGTSIARQELYGELLDEVEGALWRDEMISPWRTDTLPLELLGPKFWRVVGVDPSVAARPGDECGIVVCAASREREKYKRNAWVLADESLKAGPDEWVKVVVKTAKRWGAIVVAEENQGFDLVRMALQQADPTIPVIMVHASKGKAQRAEPIVMAYEQERVHHVKIHELLEDEMTSWVPPPPGQRSTYSPNRLDALVWGLSAVLVDDRRLRSRTGNMRVSSSQTSTQSMNGIIPAYRKRRVTDRHYGSGRRRGL